MSDLSLVDAGLRPILSALPDLKLTSETLAAVRQLSARAAPATQNPMVEWREERIDGAEGAPPVRILFVKPRAIGANAPAILEIHGGGYVMGSPDADRASYERRAEALGCVIVAVDYRLAPETPFPGPLEDCHTALRWMHAQAHRLGLDTNRIGVSGSSAGAGLAAALSLLVRQRGEPPIAFQHLFGPMLDDRTTANESNPYVGQHIWTSENNLFGWTAYLGREPGGDDVPALAAVGRETDLAGLPPTYLAVGALDLFLAENLAFVARLSEAGVPVEARVYPGAFHGFLMASESAIAREANSDSLRALRRFITQR